MGNLLTVSNLDKKFGRRQVLQQVSFEIREGEVLGLIGPNGAGKTTLLECLADLVPTNGGSLAYRDKPLGSLDRKQVLFYVPDGIVPWAEQTVKWVLRFFEKLYNQPKEKLLSLFAPLRLDEIQRAKLSTLSKGERKRLMLALGLLTSHPLLLLDEPFDGLDLRQTRDVMAMLRSDVRADRTLLLSIHQLVDAERVCDRFVLLNDGRVVAEGTLNELRELARVDQGGLEEIFLELT
ncbi:MAG TPA: ABC transporter ATP-binding protein [Pyrinomonadaceae bacterium]|nr:ABC transporter ATP-binding protein [Pyrinomonadaceae bacterium]